MALPCLVLGCELGAGQPLHDPPGAANSILRSPAYVLQETPEHAYEADNIAHGFRTHFVAGALRVESMAGSWSVTMRLAGFGREPRVEPVADARATTTANRIEFARSAQLT